MLGRGINKMFPKQMNFKNILFDYNQLLYISTSIWRVHHQNANQKMLFSHEKRKEKEGKLRQKTCFWACTQMMFKGFIPKKNDPFSFFIGKMCDKVAQLMKTTNGRSKMSWRSINLPELLKAVTKVVTGCWSTIKDTLFLV